MLFILRGCNWSAISWGFCIEYHSPVTNNLHMPVYKEMHKKLVSLESIGYLNMPGYLKFSCVYILGMLYYNTNIT